MKINEQQKKEVALEDVERLRTERLFTCYCIAAVIFVDKASHFAYARMSLKEISIS